MAKPNTKTVVTQFQNRIGGEVRFIKDRGGDQNGWAYSDVPPTDRETKVKNYKWDSGELKPIARVLRSTSASLGHAMSAYAVFAKLKSRQVSPDGKLGGKGYIQEIKTMRRQYMNVVEALSSLADTLYDELKAPHWSAESRGSDPELTDIVEDAENIRKDPEQWAEEAEEEMDEDHDGVNESKAMPKTASLSVSRVAKAYLEVDES